MLKERWVSGFFCVGDGPFYVEHGRRKYLFEWDGGCGCLPVTKKGKECLSLIPMFVFRKAFIIIEKMRNKKHDLN